MKVLGLDPGATTGVCLLEALPRGRFRWLFHDAVRGFGDALLGALLAKLKPDLVALETPAGHVHEKARGKFLLATARQAGELAATARVLGFRVFEARAEEWRLSLCESPRAKDIDVHQMVRVRVVNLPARTSNHPRDAAGVAMYAALSVAMKPTVQDDPARANRSRVVYAMTFMPDPRLADLADELEASYVLPASGVPTGRGAGNPHVRPKVPAA